MPRRHKAGGSPTLMPWFSAPNLVILKTNKKMGKCCCERPPTWHGRWRQLLGEGRYAGDD